MSETAGLVRRAWAKFRSWPLWAQIVIGVLALSVVVGPFLEEDGATKSESAEQTTTTIETTEQQVTTTERHTTTTTRTTTTTTTTSTTRPTTTTEATTTTTSASLGPNARRVTASDFGDAWPLTVDSGVLSCPVGTAVVFGDEDTAYAINGTARGLAADRGWRDIFESDIWAEDPNNPGLDLKKDIGPLIDMGLDLCG